MNKVSVPEGADGLPPFQGVNLGSRRVTPFLASQSIPVIAIGTGNYANREEFQPRTTTFDLHYSVFNKKRPLKGVFWYNTICFMGLQLSWLERVTDNDEVAGSSPAKPTMGHQLSWLEHLLCKEGVVGSNPTCSTIFHQAFLWWLRSISHLMS